MTQEAPPNISQNLSGMTPKYWWQWLLISPVMIAFLTTGIPALNNLIFSIKTGISPDRVPFAEEQNRLWKQNVDCLVSAKHHDVTTDKNIKVDVVVCPSGDILLTRASYSRGQQYWWIAAETFSKNSVEKDGAARLWMQSAIAAPMLLLNNEPKLKQSAKAPKVICTKILEEGRLLQRLRYPNGQCFDEIINTYTGDVVSRTPGTCQSHCK